MYRCLFHSAAVTAVLTALSGAVSAHAILKHAEPPPRASTNVLPSQVILDFSEALEPRFSSITLQDAQKQRFDKGDAHVAADDPKRLVVDLKPLQPGIYKVIWHAVSVDTHTTEGVYISRSSADSVQSRFAALDSSWDSFRCSFVRIRSVCLQGDRRTPRFGTAGRLGCDSGGATYASASLAGAAVGCLVVRLVVWRASGRHFRRVNFDGLD